MPVPFLPLAVDWDELISAIIPVLLTVFWILGHLMGGKPKPKQAPPRPRVVPPPAQPVAPGPGGPQPTLEETLRREVEEFMRRAQGRAPDGPKREPAMAAPPQRGPRPASPVAERPQPPRRLAEAPRPQSASSASPPRAPLPSAAAPTSVEQHVAEHLRGAKVLAAHAQTLGAGVAQADERLEERLREKFVHSLGTLEHRAADPQQKATRSPAAKQLFELLSTPGGMRQVILANEILRRPEERWT
jgi:hypothetical protein